MKRFSILFAILLILITLIPFGQAQDVVPNPSTWMPDANLRTAVETALDLGDGDTLTTEAMTNLTELTARSASITDITGLEYATNLTKLDLRSNSISSITALSGLTHLTDLWLAFNSITDISSLSGLTNLTNLTLRDNEIGDITDLGGLTNLEVLWLKNCSITDVSPLQTLTNLTTLRIAGNTLTNAHLLSTLDNLSDIDITIPAPPAVDTNAPDVSISVPSGAQNGAFEATITFTETVSDFEQSDLTLSGTATASITGFSTDDNTIFTATITPTASGDVVLSVAAGVATDAGNNNNTAAESQTVSIDMDAPGVSISVPSDVQNGAFEATITFTEAVSDFEQSDLTLSGTATASITGFSTDDNTVFTATITPTTSGDVVLSVAAGVATDAATNANTASESQTVSIDMDAPGVSISVPSDVQNGAFGATITFTEAVSDFEQSDVSVSGTVTASITGWVANADTATYTATIMPTASGSVTLSVAANVATDAANNQNTASATQTVTVDMDAPGVNISVPTDDQTGAFEATITFTEAVSDFEQSDVSVSGTAGGSITTWSASDNTTYTATITPTTSGTVILDIAANVATDAANNSNTAATTQTVTVLISLLSQQVVNTDILTLDVSIVVDADPLGVSITVPEGVQNSAFNATITFTGAVSDFEQSELTLSGTATASITAWAANSGNTVYTATITPTTSGTVILNIAASVATDAANNPNTAATAQTVTVDLDPPGVSITVPDAGQNSAFEVSITFTEVVSDFEQSDVSVSGPAFAAHIPAFAARITAWNTTDNITYTATITPRVSGDVTLSIAAEVAMDAAGNNSTASETQIVSVDMAPPGVIIFVPEGVQNGAFEVIIRFSETVSGFEQSDLSLSGTVSASVTVWNTSDNTTYTAQITPTSSGEVTLSVPAGVATDAVNNDNMVSVPQTVSIDVDRPGVSITVPSDVQNGAFNVEITFTEMVLGFEQSDLLLEDSTIATLITNWVTTDDITYTLTITPAASGTITLNIDEDVATDIAGNGNTAAQTQTVSVVQTQTYVFVADTNLEIEVRRALGLTDDVFITQEAMLDLTTLDLGPNSDPLLRITSLTGLEHATNLTELDLRSHSISDISPLAGLTNLTTLDLSRNSISDVSALEDITNLTTLDLSRNSISDVSALEDITNLTTLDLYDNSISGISALEDITNLTTLKLGSNIISDISSLSGLINLTSLYLDRNRINNATPLASLVNLETLWLSGNPLNPNPPAAMASLLTTLTQLTDVDIEQPDSNALIPDRALEGWIRSILSLDENAEITEEAMLNLTSLRSNIPGNVYSLVGLEHATNLTDIKLHGHIINDLSPLANLTNLTTLEISSTRGSLSDLSPLANLTNLTELRLFINGISDLSSLANLTNLTELILFRNDIEALNPLKKLVNLEILSLSTNNISDVTPLADLANLKRLELHGNSILDTSPLYPLTQTAPFLHCTIVITEYPPWDVNEDESVDASDSALVTAALGQSGDDILNSRTDVNGDGTVDADDLTLVTDNLDAGNNAPAIGGMFTVLDPATLEKLDPTALEAQLDILRAKSDGSLKYQRAIALLESMLSALRPAETLLLANYPNPFNPETWIPYELANPSEVKITIYDMRGTVVRRLDLGHQLAGYYTSRVRAAYWDGKNNVGERVASGIYFYQLQADHTSLLRKMVILQ